MMIDRSNPAASEIRSDPVHARYVLAKEVGEVLAAANGKEPVAAPLVRVAVPLEGVDPVHWLRVQPVAVKLYWSGRDDELVVAALGAADVCAGAERADLAALQQLVSGLGAAESDVRYYGGMRFDSHQTPDASWACFGAYRFVLPRFELSVQGAQGWLACNLVLPRDRMLRPRILEQIERLHFPAHGLADTVPLPVSRQDNPTEEGWHRNVRYALSAFQETPLEKVVLARRVTYGFPGKLDPLVLLRHLKTITPGCFHFCFQVQRTTAFVGASPERLFRRERRALRSEAVAGTRPRGQSARDDARLRRELLLSEKDHREHAYVRRSIRETLGDLCEDLEVDASASEMRLASGRHLVSEVYGTLRTGVTDVDVLRALHPTPAVGGYPADAALRVIRGLEAFDRGWYAGPMGWIGREAAEFAVAIRSGLVEPLQLSLYSGAGIVPGSVPEGEWEEIEHKVGDFINVLGLDLRRAKY